MLTPIKIQAYYSAIEISACVFFFLNRDLRLYWPFSVLSCSVAVSLCPLQVKLSLLANVLQSRSARKHKLFRSNSTETKTDSISLHREPRFAAFIIMMGKSNRYSHCPLTGWKFRQHPCLCAATQYVVNGTRSDV